MKTSDQRPATSDQRPATSPIGYGRDSLARVVVHLSELKSIMDELDAESDNQSMGTSPTSYRSYGHDGLTDNETDD
jgi:hypothetical protein